jgi:alpha-beta hydrolase superfamily lysophospholipase
MEYEIRTLPLRSTDNIHTLMGKIYIPKGELKGLFHIVHGMTEYIDRYEHLFSFLAENGYVAFGFDNLGHGNTARDKKELGFIAHEDGWKYLVYDSIAYGKTVKEMFPQKPLTLMGHSMGSFITRLAVEHSADIYDKFIICGTAGPNPLCGIGIILSNIIKAIKGEKHISKMVDNLAFASYNKRFDNITEYEWLTKDREIINKYISDEFCNFKFTVSAIIDLMKLLSNCNRNEWFKKIKKDLPIFLIAGEDDPVGDYGKGVREVYEKLKSQNCNVTLKLYKNCRHEIHNDSCKEEMFSDILKFIE